MYEEHVDKYQLSRQPSLLVFRRLLVLSTHCENMSKSMMIRSMLTFREFTSDELLKPFFVRAWIDMLLLSSLHEISQGRINSYLYGMLLGGC